MHPLTAFFEEKNRLDQTAIAQGRPLAPPIEVMPRLMEALEECARKKSERFSGTSEQLNYLCNAARIMAVFSIWEANPRWVDAGMLALIFESAQTDSRLALTHFSMLNHAAKKIGVNFDEMAKLWIDRLGLEMTEMLNSFVARAEDRRAISAFGYREVVRGGRVDFKNVM